MAIGIGIGIEFSISIFPETLLCAVTPSAQIDYKLYYYNKSGDDSGFYTRLKMIVMGSDQGRSLWFRVSRYDLGIQCHIIDIFSHYSDNR